MNCKTKLKKVIVTTMIVSSINSVAFARYTIDTPNQEISQITIIAKQFNISDMSKYAKFDLYIDGVLYKSGISSFSRNYNVGTTYEIKNIKINDGYILESIPDNLSGIINDNTDVKFVFSTSSYSINYELNGGTISGSKETYNVETDTFTLPTPTRTGYTFLGWTGTGLSSTPTKNVIISKGTTGDKSYTANWSKNTYSISYNLNNGSISNQPTSYQVDTSDFTLPTPSRNGYNFTGWTGTGLSSATKSVTIAKGSTGNRTYTANWSLINYSVSYNMNGGSMSGQTTSYNIESNSFSLPTPSRNGYTFTGWSGTDISGTSYSVSVGKGSTGNRSYTANWVDNIAPGISAWITYGPAYETSNGKFGYRVNIQASVSDAGSGINRVLTYYNSNGSWVGETNITGSLTDSFRFSPGYREILVVVYDNAGNGSQTLIGVQCG